MEFISFVHCDITLESDVENAINTTIARHGQLEIMVNNARIIDEPKLSILDNDNTTFERVVSVNLIGVFLGTKHATRVMVPKCSGSIIPTSKYKSGHNLVVDGGYSVLNPAFGLFSLT
ncbi:hypothetical protein L6452_21071 [Arctium lappa]|uniref:Uncharacterized protein n=1 Tax=Arctium lappa TaxID=4217 RepID=A0ACB9BDX6_ARCLA|nr:hypothetical protein L6452_21071 [Arctium lappa]